MNLNEEEVTNLSELINFPVENLKTFLNAIENYDGLSAEKQKYYDILIKLLIEHHKCKSLGKYLDSYLKNLPNSHSSSEQINLLENFIDRNNSIFLCDKKRFVDLNWRLEAKISSRSVHEMNNFEPKILINMKAKENDCKEPKNICVDVNPSNLNHIISKLEQALIDSKSLLRKQN